MVRTGGIAFTIDVTQPIGRRISALRLLRTDAPVDPGRDYVVAGWGSVNEGTQGPPVWDVVADYIAARGEVMPVASGHVTVAGAP
jgi:sulfur-oxidizing protein SoxB